MIVRYSPEYERAYKCVQIAVNEEGYTRKELAANDALLGTVIARILWERFNTNPPIDNIPIYCDQFAVHDPPTKEAEYYGACLQIVLADCADANIFCSKMHDLMQEAAKLPEDPAWRTRKQVLYTK